MAPLGLAARRKKGVRVEPIIWAGAGPGAKDRRKNGGRVESERGGGQTGRVADGRVCMAFG